MLLDSITANANGKFSTFLPVLNWQLGVGVIFYSGAIVFAA
jgi:hypothetical protein